MYKPMPMDEKISKNLKLDFSGLKGLLFCLISTWTGKELAGDDVENCENSQLTLKNLSHSSNFGSVSVEILLK